MQVVYTLDNSDELKIAYTATTDKATPVNLTDHSYFNLAGHGTGDVLDHQLMIDGDRFAPVDRDLIPTGKFLPVVGTPFDLREMTAIGVRIEDDNQQLAFCGGYNVSFALSNADGGLARAAAVYEPSSGRLMEVFSVEPSVEFYSGNYLDGTIVGKGGKVYGAPSGFCLATQHFSDSPNKSGFPSTILRPGEEYSTVTVYKVSAK